MNHSFKKLLSVLLSLIIIICAVSPLANAIQAEKEKYYPSIVVPGVFQCDNRLYDDDGNEMLKSDGTPYERPFFIDATQDVIKDALENALIPVSKLKIPTPRGMLPSSGWWSRKSHLRTSKMTWTWLKQ